MDSSMFYSAPVFAALLESRAPPITEFAGFGASPLESENFAVIGVSPVARRRAATFQNSDQ